MNSPLGNEWLDIFRRNRAAWIEQDKVKSPSLQHDQERTYNHD
jgi:hypothetical protein